MKKILIILLALCVSISVFGQVELSDLQNGVFHLAGAGFVQVAATALTAVSTGWRGRGGVDTKGSAWLFVEAAQAGSIDVEYPEEVYVNFVSRYDRDSLFYGTVTVYPDNAAPTGCVGGSGTVTCDVPTNGKTLTLFSWNGATFTDTEEVASSGEFSSISPGNYVVGFTGDEFCTIFLTVS